MFNNPRRLIVLAILFLIILGCEFVLGGVSFLGFSDPTLFWVISGQVLLGCAMVAWADPTFGQGYVFSAVMFVAFTIFAITYPANHNLRGIAFLLAFICPGTMAAVYEIRIKQNYLRSKRRLNESGPIKV